MDIVWEGRALKVEQPQKRETDSGKEREAEKMKESEVWRPRQKSSIRAILPILGQDTTFFKNFTLSSINVFAWKSI